MSEFKVGDIVRTKKVEIGSSKLCQKENPYYGAQCTACSMFQCKPVKIVLLRKTIMNDCEIETSFQLKCNTSARPLPNGKFRIAWRLDALEKAFDWVRIK